MAFHAHFFFKGREKGAEHVHQQPFAVLAHDGKNVRIHHRGKHDGAHLFTFVCEVDLTHRLVRLVRGVNEGDTHAPGREVELRDDGVAEGLGGDAGSVRDEETGACGLEWPVARTWGAKRAILECADARRCPALRCLAAYVAVHLKSPLRAA